MLIFKYMMVGVNVLNEFLNLICKSVVLMNGFVSYYVINCKFLIFFIMFYIM